MNSQNTAVWQKILSKDEIVKEEFSISNRYIKIWGIVSVVITSISIVIPIILAFYYFFYLKRANIYAFTNKRILIHKGWLSTHLTSVDYHKITDIHVKEGFFERIITKSGSLIIDTAGTSGEEIILKNVANPYKLKKLLDELKDN